MIREERKDQMVERGVWLGHNVASAPGSSSF